VFPADSFERIRATGLFGHIVVSDSHPRAVAAAAAAPDFVHVDSTAAVLVEPLRSNR
jgi:hypothetical protein